MYARDVTLVSPIALALFGGRLKIFDRHCVVAVEGESLLSSCCHTSFLHFCLSTFFSAFHSLSFLTSFYQSCFSSFLLLLIIFLLFLFFLLLFIRLVQLLLTQTIIWTIISPSNLNPFRVDRVQGNFRSFEIACFSASVCRTSIRREGGLVT